MGPASLTAARTTLASNYNPEASIDDAPASTRGAPNPDAANYDAGANDDDGSCILPVARIRKPTTMTPRPTPTTAPVSTRLHRSDGLQLRCSGRHRRRLLRRRARHVGRGLPRLRRQLPQRRRWRRHVRPTRAGGMHGPCGVQLQPGRHRRRRLLRVLRLWRGRPTRSMCRATP